ncbi:MAG TPA: hypothetical protein PLM93_12145 [Sulfuricurvum sp.]|nr:MAG: hypothetical protein B7X89_11575 [Sulfuricurvum sp. 17-40-25]HQS67928.1 hypothetical protein [Sulfuricurvum sp.]HQT37623.1 hypothetical protein [Sulfuricurvum sp.]
MANDEVGTGTSAENEAPSKALGMAMPPKDNEVKEGVEAVVSDMEKGIDESKAAVTDKVNDSGEMDENPVLIIRIGDLFQSQDGTLILNIPDVLEPVGGMRNYKVRNFATIIDSVLVPEKDLHAYIETNQLAKLATYRDRMEEISKVLFLNEGDIFTQNGEPFLEVLSTEMLYVDPNNKGRNVIAVKHADGLVSYVDALKVKAFVYENTDQFPPQNL